MKLSGFVIVTKDGVIKTRGGKYRKGTTGSFYTSQSQAQQNARSEGDSVVPVTVDLETAPLFIRARKVVPA